MKGSSARLFLQELLSPPSQLRNGLSPLCNFSTKTVYIIVSSISKCAYFINGLYIIFKKKKFNSLLLFATLTVNSYACFQRGSLVASIKHLLRLLRWGFASPSLITFFSVILSATGGPFLFTWFIRLPISKSTQNFTSHKIWYFSIAVGLDLTDPSVTLFPIHRCFNYWSLSDFHLIISFGYTVFWHFSISCKFSC